MISVGFCNFSITLATVKVFPDPVTPKSVWYLTFFLILLTNLSTAFCCSGISLCGLLNLKFIDVF